MIKKYKQYIKESLLDNIRGLNEDEILDSLKKLDPWKMYLKSIEMNFEFGIKYAVDNYGYKKEYKKYLQIEKDFKSILDNCEIRKFQDLNIKNTNVYYILNNKIFMSLEGNCIIDYNYIERFINEFEITWDDLTKIFKGLVLKLLNIDCTYVSFINTENYREWNYIENKLLNLKESLLDKITGPTEEEIKKVIFNNPIDKILKLSLKNGYLNGIKYVFENIIDKGYNTFDDLIGFKTSLSYEYSAIFKDFDILKYLDSKGVFDVFELDNILKNSIINSYYDNVKYLLNKKEYSFKDVFKIEKNKIYLLNPILRKDIKMIKILLDNGVYDFDSYLFFNKAMNYGDDEIAELFIDKFGTTESLLNNLSGPNEEDVWNHIQTFSDWEKRMYKCIRIGNVDFLQKVINQNPDYMFNKIHFKFPLEAMKHNDNETKYNIIKLLLDNGANLNEIHLSVLSKVMTQFNLDDRTRRMIIDDTNNKMNLRESLLDKIKGPSEEEFIKDFTKKKPLKRFGIFTNINNANDLLIASCEGGSLNGVKTAIENGADINYSNNAALTIVLSRGFLDIFIYLDDKFNLINKDTLFRSMISSIYSDDSNMLKYLIDNYSHKIKTDLNERELLLKCVERNNLDALKYLISLGCDFRYGNYQIYNIALNMKHYDILDYLLSLGEIKKSLSVYLYNTANYRNDEKLLNILKKYNII